MQPVICQHMQLLCAVILVHLFSTPSASLPPTAKLPTINSYHQLPTASASSKLPLEGVQLGEGVGYWERCKDTGVCLRF